MPPIGQGLDQASETLTMLLYGKEGSAKTTEALGLARLGKIVAIDAEGGMKPTPLRARGIPVENIDVWPPEGNAGHISFETIETEVYIPIRKMKEDGDPDCPIGVVFDSFTEIANRLVKQAADEGTIRDQAKGKTRGRFQVNIEDYGTSTQMIRQLLRMFRDLGIHVIITALERRDQDDDGFVQYGPALGPAAANDTMGMVDVVIWTQDEELGPDSKQFFTGTTRPRERHRAKDRFGVLPVRMIEPSADRVIGYLRGEIDKTNDERHKAAVAASRPKDPAK